jgi:hypothetical protein
MPIVVNMVQDPWHMLPGMPLATCIVRGSRVETHPKGWSVQPSMQGEKERRAPTHNGFSYLQPAFLLLAIYSQKVKLKIKSS